MSYLDRVKETIAIMKQTTPGTWKRWAQFGTESADITLADDNCERICQTLPSHFSGQEEKNGNAIVAAHNSLPDLEAVVAELERLRQEHETMRRALNCLRFCLSEPKHTDQIEAACEILSESDLP